MMLDELIGQECGFYGAEHNVFKLGRHVFEAVEDEDDGYRSMMAEVREIPNPQGFVFYKRAFAMVRVEAVDREGDNFTGYELVGIKDGHVWLRLGTNRSDDYYPCFVFEYMPKA